MNSRFALRRSSHWSSSPMLLTAAVVVPLALAAAWGAIALAGTKTGVVLALVAVLAPITAYAALTSPLVFPFCLFVILIPFDNLITISAFGSLTKFLGLMCAAAIGLWLFRRRKYVVPDRAILAWSVFVLLAIASATWAIDPKQVLSPLFTMILLFLLYAELSFVPIDNRTLTIVIQAVILSGAIAAAYGAYLFHSGVDIAASGRLIIGTNSVADTGNHIDPNEFAAALLLPISLSLVASVEARRMLVRLVAMACLVLLGAGIAFAGSRGSLVAIFAMLIFLLIRSRKRLLLGGVGVAGLGIALASYSNVLQRFGDVAASGGAGRLEIWKVGLAAFIQHPIFGAGFGNFTAAYNQAYLLVSLTKNMYWNEAPHNNLILVGVELGVVGLAIFLYAWWTQFRTLRAVTTDDPYYTLRVALEAALVALFVASLFLGTLSDKYLWLAFILVMLTRNASLANAMANGTIPARKATS
jgi:O-antigen ligase